jgi:hypothetical protein
MPYIDLAFRLIGTSVPVDHGYAVYAALSRIVPEIHDARTIGVQPIHGTYGGNSALHDDDLLGYMSAKAAKEEGAAGSADVRRAVLEATRAISLLPCSGDVTFLLADRGRTTMPI